jgi:polynucleotide 5'-hydroxyl-kinase GRC3/NOL9
MICGPKSSGKSTFAKLITNKLLYATVETSNRSKSAKPTGVALLDLDPGQPEYSPPGQLSLIHLHASNFGPPYSHPTPGAESRVIRSHSIGAVSPSLDPSLYMACALDLFAHYRNLLSLIANCPLIINTPGWVLGTGLEILVGLIAKVHPTEVIYMSQEGPVEVVESLRDAGKSIPLITLPSQGSEYTTRTAAHLRTMQTMSYFHLDSSSSNGLAWKDSPLTSVPPWQISYSGEGGGILGIMCYGEQPPANLLADTIDGSLLAVVVIDEIAGIPGWESSGPMDTDEENAQNDTMPEHNDAEIRAFDEESFQPQNLEKPLIVQTPDEDIPYFNPANAMSLNPKYSHSIGLVLVRGIDVARRQLQVLTSIAPSVIEEINEAGKSIILVSGKLDTPGWAYTEELMQKTKLEKASRKKGDAMDVDESDEEDLEGSDRKTERLLGDGFHDAPWIERLEGSQGRGLGARVWRVRRDLGRTGDGGD